MLFWKQPPGRRRSIMSSPGALWSSAETRWKEAVRALKEGIKRNRSDKAAIFGKGYEKYIPAAIYTAHVLEQAPVIVFFINSKGKDYYGEFPIDEHLMEMADIQSVARQSRICAWKRRRGISGRCAPAIFSSLMTN